ncbi:hypothetical protein FP744_10009270 [Trichoderma asperellum]|nr:hypothetical protein LI328DRAFT_11434 [Trichoderma asperelloides]
MPLHVTPLLNGGSSNLIIPIPIAQASRPIQALKTGQFSNHHQGRRQSPDPRSLLHSTQIKNLPLHPSWSTASLSGAASVRVSSPLTRTKSLFEAIQANHSLSLPPPTGLAVRFWQVGIEMRPFFNRSSLWAYPVYALGGASFGHWLQGVDDRQTEMLGERKRALLEKRARKAQRDAERGQEA